MFKKFFFILAIGFCLTACAQDSEAPQQACTLEAKLCPDGSTVGRTGPSCEFAECPASDASVENPSPSLSPTNLGWTVVVNEKDGVSFEYPPDIPQNYTHLMVEDEFAPSIQATEKEFVCQEPDYKDGPPFTTESRTIEGKEYCLKIQTSAAAGSAYSSYFYSTPLNDKVVNLSFTLQQVNCGNFDEPQKTECEQEQTAFNADDLAISMFNTVKFLE